MLPFPSPQPGNSRLVLLLMGKRTKFGSVTVPLVPRINESRESYTDCRPFRGLILHKGEKKELWEDSCAQELNNASSDYRILT